MPSFSLLLENRKTRFHELTGNKTASTVIVGGGLAGLTCAYYLAKAGHSVALLEAKTIGSGTSGHTTAHVTSQHDLIYDKLIKRFGLRRAKLIARANQEAIGDIYKIITEEDIDCDFSFLNSYLFTNQEGNIPKIIDENIAANKLGIDAYLTESAWSPVPFKKAVVFPNQAQFNPKKYMDGLADAIVKHGGTIFENSRVLHIKGKTVVTKSGKVTADNIVIATHAPVINFPGMYFARMYQSRAYVVALESGAQFEGMWTNADKKGHTFRLYKDYLLLSGEDHKCGYKGGENHYGNLKSFSKLCFPSSVIKYQWSAQDCITLDELPYIGHYSKNTDYLYVATGFRKWGMTQTNIAGKVISDLITGKENPFTEIYTPQRKVVPMAILKAIAINGAVAADYAAGLINLTNPRCSHMKCGLRWNKDEETWDCPCHGSRFEKDGTVIDSPAIHDLKRQ